MLTLLILFVLGLAFLILGADILVRGAVGIAAAMGISPLVLGLTVVAFGTSSPELAVSLKAQYVNASDVALGNVVGSNICNILLILGCSALLAPIAISTRVISRDLPVMIGVSFLPLLLGFDGAIGRRDGILLFSLFLAHTYWIVRTSRREIPENVLIQDNHSANISYHRFWNPCMIVAGLILLFLGSNWVLDGAVSLVRFLGITELVIGLTIIAVSTSLPEIATSMVAAFRGQTDIAVGNVIGSNIFNVLLILGLSCAVSPRDLQVAPNALQVDIPVMIAVSIACLPIFFTRGTIDRWEGFLFIFYYCAYTAYLILRAGSHALPTTYGALLLGFAIPVTLITLLVSILGSIGVPIASKHK